MSTELWLRQIESLEAHRPSDTSVGIQVEVAADGGIRAQKPSARTFVRTRLRDVEILPTSGSWSVLQCRSERAMALVSPTPGPRRTIAAGCVEGDGWPTVDLISFASSSQQNGVLTLSELNQQGEHHLLQRSLYFFRGNVLWATSSDPGERLGPFLSQRGLLSMEQLQAALSEGPHQLMRACVDRGFVPVEQVPFLAGQFILEQVEFWVGAERGVWSFSRLDERLFLDGAVHVPATRLLVDALRRTDELRVFKHRLGPPGASYHASGDAFDTLMAEGLEPVVLEECRLLHACLGTPIQVADLMRNAGLGPFETHRALYHLLKAQLVFVKPPVRSASRPEPKVDLREVVHVHTLALNEILHEAQQNHQIQTLLEVIRAFDEQEADRWPGLPLRAQEPLVDGDVLLRRLEAYGTSALLLSETLSELLFTALLRASEALGRRKGDDLARRVRLIHRMLGGGEGF